MERIKQDLIELKREVPYYAENFIKKAYMLFGDKKTAETITAACINQLAALHKIQMLDDDFEDGIINHIYINSIYYKPAREASKLTEAITKSKERKDE